MKSKVLAQNVAVFKSINGMSALSLLIINGMSALSLLIIGSPTDYNRNISKQEIKKKTPALICFYYKNTHYH